MNSQLEELISLLASERQNLADHKLAMQGALDQFMASDDVYTYNHEQAELKKTAVAELETNIRELALAEYATNQDKHPHEKVEIKIFKTFTVLDQNAVREWCFKNHPLALKPDMKMVEADAKAGPVDGTETGEEPRAMIASKL